MIEETGAGMNEGLHLPDAVELDHEPMNAFIEGYPLKVHGVYWHPKKGFRAETQIPDSERARYSVPFWSLVFPDRATVDYLFSVFCKMKTEEAIERDRRQGIITGPEALRIKAAQPAT